MATHSNGTSCPENPMDRGAWRATVRGHKRVGHNLTTKQQLLLLLLSHFSRVNSVRPHRRQPTRLPRPWDSLGKNPGVGCHFLLQRIKVKSESEVVQSCLTLSNPWTPAFQASPSMGFSRQEYWSGVPLPSPL